MSVSFHKSVKNGVKLIYEYYLLIIKINLLNMKGNIIYHKIH